MRILWHSNRPDTRISPLSGYGPACGTMTMRDILDRLSELEAGMTTGYDLGPHEPRKQPEFDNGGVVSLPENDDGTRVGALTVCGYCGQPDNHLTVCPLGSPAVQPAAPAQDQDYEKKLGEAI